jgi:hypothetical protein
MAYAFRHGVEVLAAGGTFCLAGFMCEVMALESLVCSRRNVWAFGAGQVWFGEVARVTDESY